jgi:hypothetical protein
VVLLVDKLKKTVVIGRAAKPWCYENSNIKPVISKSNKVQMTSRIMEEWLTAFNRRMKQQNCNILLFMDSATCHPHNELSSV